jgi:hypothetical protein
MEAEEDTLDDKYDRGLGKNKQSTKKDQKQTADAQKEAQRKKLEELKA